MKILVTGFEPFGGESENPTAQIISALEGVETLLLPVSFAEAPRIALQKIKETQPDAVILLGQAGGRAAISLERVAINLTDAKNPDNDGRQPIEEPIFSDGPAAYMCRLPLREICASIRQKGIPCQISNTAGTYVCNALYYTIMHRQPSLPAIFIHVPYTPAQAAAKTTPPPSMSLPDMTAAIASAMASLPPHP